MSTTVNIHSTPFWESVTRIRESLPPGDVQFVTVNQDFDNADHGAPTCEASREIAARLIAQKTHHISTPEETAKFHAEQRQREIQCRAESERLIEHRARLALPNDLIELLRGSTKKPKKGNDGDASCAAWRNRFRCRAGRD